MCALLSGRKSDPLYFDDLEFEITDNRTDLLPEQHSIGRYARLAYELIYQLYKEGKLRFVDKLKGSRKITYMYMD